MDHLNYHPHESISPPEKLNKKLDSRERGIPREIETKILAPLDRPDYFVTREFFGNVNGLLAQAKLTVAEGDWQELQDVRLKRDQQETVANQVVFENMEQAVKANQQLKAIESLNLPLRRLVNDQENSAALIKALHYLGFQAEIEDGRLIVIGYDQTVEPRSVRFRSVSAEPDTEPIFKFTVKEKILNQNKRRQVINRPEIEVSLTDIEPLKKLLESAGYNLAQATEKLRRSWILPAQKYMGVDGRIRQLKNSVSIEINWPPGDLPPWLELESTEKFDEKAASEDIKIAAKLLGFSNGDLRPIGTSELFKKMAKQRKETPQAIQEIARQFTAADRKRMAAKIADLQNLEKDLQSAFETP